MNDLNEPMARLRPFLRAYLTQNGVEIQSNNSFCCFMHKEKNASANLISGSDETKWFCHVEGLGGDICDACHYIEGRPQGGPGWFKETFLYLCDMFGIEVPEANRELNAEEQKQLQSEQALSKAAGLLLSMKKSDLVEAKLAEYGWSKATLTKFGIGGVTSYDKYIKSMTKMGFPADLLHELGLDDKRIFRPECLIYTLKDANGKPVAFSGRYLMYERDKAAAEATQSSMQELKYCSKYVNTKFEKGKSLFGFHLAKAASSMVYAFEGYADCVTAYNAGLLNSVAVCGCIFNETHLEMCRQAGIHHIICAFDADAGGEGGRQKFVDLYEEKIGDAGDIRAEIVDIPRENDKKMDPDEFIRTQGLAKFRAIPRRSCFYWSIQKTVLAEDQLHAAGAGAKRIVQQPDPLLRYSMLEQLSQATGMPIESLWASVVRYAGQSTGETAAAIQKSAAWMTWMSENKQQAKKAIVEVPEVPQAKVEAPGRAMLIAPGLELASLPETDKTEELADTWK